MWNLKQYVYMTGTKYQKLCTYEPLVFSTFICPPVQKMVLHCNLCESILLVSGLAQCSFENFQKLKETCVFVFHCPFSLSLTAVMVPLEEFSDTVTANFSPDTHNYLKYMIKTWLSYQAVTKQNGRNWSFHDRAS